MGHYFSLIEYHNQQTQNQVNMQQNQFTGVDIGQGMNTDQGFIGQAFQQESSVIGADPSWVPSDTENAFLLRAAQDITIRGSVGSLADSTSEKINSFVSSIGNMFGNQNGQNQNMNQQTTNNQTNQNHIVKVETGIAVQLDSNEILSICPTNATQLSGITLTNSILFPALDGTAHPENGIILYIHNNTSGDIMIHRGDILAIGIITEVGMFSSSIKEQENNQGINLTKE